MGCIETSKKIKISSNCEIEKSDKKKSKNRVTFKDKDDSNLTPKDRNKLLYKNIPQIKTYCADNISELNEVSSSQEKSPIYKLTLKENLYQKPLNKSAFLSKDQLIKDILTSEKLNNFSTKYMSKSICLERDKLEETIFTNEVPEFTLKEEIKNIKIILIGDKEVGKSSFLRIMSGNKFDNYYIPSISEESSLIRRSFNGRELKISLIVKMAKEIQYSNYAELRQIEDADFYFAFYNLSDIYSFKKIKRFIKTYLLRQNRRKVILVGNKSDLVKNETNKEISNSVHKFTHKHRILNFNISLRENLGITDLMNKVSNLYLLRDVLDTKEPEKF